LGIRGTKSNFLKNWLKSHKSLGIKQVKNTISFFTVTLECLSLFRHWNTYYLFKIKKMEQLLQFIIVWNFY
jgi:hypothetical protein